MENLIKEEPEKKKVFFITSNAAKLDKFLEYQIPRNRGIINLKAGIFNAEFKKEIKHKNSTFSVYINSFEIDKANLREEDQDPNTKRYKFIITLKYNKLYFPSEISFVATKNNFIYDFKFNEYRGWGKVYAPPFQINFSQLEQLKIYNEYLENILKKEKNEEIYADLITESQKVGFGKKIYLDFFLEIFKICHKEKIVKLFLKSFKIENILLQKDFEYENYEPMLNSIENDFNIITQYCNSEEDKYIYYIIFYTLSLFVRNNYDKEKANKMLNNKNLWEYFIKIIPNKYQYFQNLDIPEELMNKMFEQDLTIELIKGILGLCSSFEKILILINSKIEIVSNCCKENELILMSSLTMTKKTDNLEKIFEEIEKIIKYESNNNKIFISFDEKFWENYIDFNNDLKKLYIIKNVVLLCSNIEKNLKDYIMKLNDKIHKAGLDSIEAGTLKNEEILNFINNDIFFLDEKYSTIFYRPLDIINGLDFEIMSEYFFTQWNNSNIYKIYSFADYDFKSRIVDRINDLKHFGKLLKLFDYKNKNIFDYRLIQKLTAKFKNLCTNGKPELCPNFYEDIAYFIFIIDFQNMYDMPNFLSGTINKYIVSMEIKKSIYCHLLINYKNISLKVIESILDYLLNNIELLKANEIFIILEKINSKKLFELFLNKLEKFVIKEEELFNQEKKTKSFELLEGIIEHKLFDKFNFEELKKINYVKYSLQNKENILKKIKVGEIYYNSLKNIDSNFEQTKIFEEKLNILLFKNKNDVEECITILQNKLISINENILILQKILFKFKNVDKYKNEINKIKNLVDKIKLGMINEIDKPEFKNDIDEINNDFNKIDLDKMSKYKQSKFFMLIYETEKLNNIIPLKEKEYFEQAENDFNKLKLLFESQKWYEEIPAQLIMDCIKCIKNKKRNNLRNELNTLIEIFKIEEFDDLKMHSLLLGILSFFQKEEILLVAKNLYNIIIELEAIQTDLFKEFIKIRNNLLIKFDYKEILNLAKILEYFGLNIIDPDENDIIYIDLLLNNFAENSFKFLANIDDNDIKTYEELINNNEDKSINNDDIKEMKKCSNFIRSLGQIKGSKNDQDLIKEFINEIQRTKTISESFKNYAKCSEKILKLLVQK